MSMIQNLLQALERFKEEIDKDLANYANQITLFILKN